MREPKTIELKLLLNRSLHSTLLSILQHEFTEAEGLGVTSF